jgi:hypothetical protein
MVTCPFDQVETAVQTAKITPTTAVIGIYISTNPDDKLLTSIITKGLALIQKNNIHDDIIKPST